MCLCEQLPAMTKMGFGSFELGFQVVVSCLVWVLGNEILSLEEQ